MATVFTATLALSRAEPCITYHQHLGVNGSLRSKKKAGITKECSLHTLRHSFATHLLYLGYDIYTISQLLGHASIRTTIVYLHIVPARYAELRSPLDFFEQQEEGSSDG